LYLQRESEIFNLESFLKKIKSNKNFSTDLQLEFNIQNSNSYFNSQFFNDNSKQNVTNEKDPDIMIKKIIDHELEMAKEIYQQTTKIALNEKKKEKEKINQIKNLKNELENLKNPITENISNINNLNTLPSSNFIKTTHTINNEINTFKNAEGSCLFSNEKSSKIKEKEKLIEILANKLELKQNELNNLNDKLVNLKSENDQLSRQWINMNSELSEKFSNILKLEMKKEKLKTKHKKQDSKTGNYNDSGNIKNYEC
jgi:DNA repair exonuclease SbcCD ATPase subunit